MYTCINICTALSPCGWLFVGLLYTDKDLWSRSNHQVVGQVTASICVVCTVEAVVSMFCLFWDCTTISIFYSPTTTQANALFILFSGLMKVSNRGKVALLKNTTVVIDPTGIRTHDPLIRSRPPNWMTKAPGNSNMLGYPFMQLSRLERQINGYLERLSRTC